MTKNNNRFLLTASLVIAAGLMIVENVRASAVTAVTSSTFSKDSMFKKVVAAQGQVVSYLADAASGKKVNMKDYPLIQDAFSVIPSSTEVQLSDGKVITKKQFKDLPPFQQVAAVGALAADFQSKAASRCSPVTSTVSEQDGGTSAEHKR